MTNLTQKPISRRTLLKLIGVGSASALLAACTPKPAVTVEPTKAEDLVVATPGVEQGALTVLLCCGTDETHVLQQKFNEYFDSTYGGMKSDLQLTPAGQNYFEKLQTLFAAGTPPDVFDMWEGYVAPYAANGALLDLTP
jgi:ABC-type glycerol-3-phosphate transport system substrate-binding protein